MLRGKTSFFGVPPFSEVSLEQAGVT